MESKKADPKNFPVEEFPTIKEVDDLIEGYLRYIYEDDYNKFVLKQNEGRYILITKGYRFYSPVAITTVSHPDDENRALFINIERSFPISSEIEFIWVSNALGETFNIKYEEIERVYKTESNDSKYTVRYVVVTARLHALAIKDPSWFYLTLSKILKIDNLILGEVRSLPENTIDHGKIGKKESKDSIEYT